MTLVNGSDVGVFAHGDNARELELLVEYGLGPVDALRAATSTAARVLHVEDAVGSVAAGKLAESDRRRGGSDAGDRGAAQGPARDEGRGDLQEPVTCCGAPLAARRNLGFEE